MKIINEKYEILEDIYFFNKGSFHIVYDHKENKRYLSLILNDISKEFFSEIFELYLKNKFISHPVIFNPINLEKIYFFDEYYININSIIINFNYLNLLPLPKFEFNNINTKINIFKTLNIITKWLNNNGYSIGNISHEFILVDNFGFPYFILIKNNSNYEKDIYFLSILAKDFLSIPNYENILKENTSNNEEFFNILSHYLNFNFNISFDFYEEIKESIINDFNNFINKNNENIFNFNNNISKNFNKIKNNNFIINLSQFPPNLYTLASDLLSDLSYFNEIVFLRLNPTPDYFSIFYEIVEKLYNNPISKPYIDLENIIINKIFYKLEDLHNIQFKLLTNEIINLLQYISNFYKIIIFINNFDFIDKYSLELLYELINFNNNNLLFFINSNNDKKLNFNLITYNNFINIDNYYKTKNFFINKIIDLFSLSNKEEEINFLNNFTIEKLYYILSNNFNNYLIFENNNITLNQKSIANFLINQETNIISSILKNIDLNLFSLYLYYFDKPPKIEYFKDIEGHNLIPIINFFIKNKIFIKVEDERFLPVDIRLSRMITLEYVSQKHNKKKIFNNIISIYLKNIDKLNNTEIYALIFYLNELKNYKFLGEIFYNKVLYYSFIKNNIILQDEYFKLINKIKNKTKNFTKIDDELTKIVFIIYLLRIYQKNKSKLYLKYLNKELENNKNSKYFYILLFEKILYLISIGKIIDSKEYLNIIEKYRNNFNLTDFKIYYLIYISYYNLNYEHKQCFYEGKNFLKFIININEYNKEKDLVLFILSKVANSSIYILPYKKSLGYLKYFLKTALNYNDIKYTFYAYSYIGSLNYRNKYFKEASYFLNQAYELSLKLYDQNLYFMALNNKNILELNYKNKIKNSILALKFSFKIKNPVNTTLSLCNLFLNLVEQNDLNLVKKFINDYNNYFLKIDNISGKLFLRRLLHLYIILSQILLYLNLNQFIKNIFQNLIKIYDLFLIGEKNPEEINDLYFFTLSLYKYIIIDILKEDINEIKFNDDKTKNLIINNYNFKETLIEYFNNKNKILNVDFIFSIFFDFTFNLFNKNELNNLTIKIIENFKNNLLLLPKDFIIYYRILNFNKDNSDYKIIILLNYIEKYFKLYDIDLWSSSGKYLKLFIILNYLKLNSKLNLKINNELIYSFINFINYIKKIVSNSTNFSHIKNIIKEIEEIVENNYNIKKFHFKNIKYKLLISEDNLFNLLFENYKNNSFNYFLDNLLNITSFHRLIFFKIENNKDIKIIIEISKNKILYNENEPIYNFWEKDFNKLIFPNNIYFKKSQINQIITIPIYNNNLIKRYQFLKKIKNAKIDIPLYGFIYIDKKSPIKTLINENELYLLTLLFSNYFIQYKNELYYMKDKLTETLLRDVFYNKVNEIIEKRETSKSHVLMMIDIDNFKKINDYFGHNIGDQVLKNIAKIILNSTRNSDFVGRYGGEEFLVFLPYTDIKNGFFIAERIRKSTENYAIQSIKQTVSVSIGISIFPENGLILDELIKKADKAMYFAKNLGKNRTIVYQE